MALQYLLRWISLWGREAAIIAACPVLHRQTAWAATLHQLWGERDTGFVQVQEQEVFLWTKEKVWFFKGMEGFLGVQIAQDSRGS